MIKTTTVIFIFIAAISVSSIQAVPNYGWEISQNSSVLYMNGTRVFDTRETLTRFPVSGRDNITQFSLYLLEYYVSKGDRDSVSNLLYYVRQEKEDYELLDYLISVFWRLERGDIPEAIGKLDDYLKKTKSDEYYVDLANAIKSTIKTQGSSKQLDAESIKNLSCSRSRPFYGFCRLLKLRLQLERLTTTTDTYHRDYMNLDRVLAPFFEDPELNYIFFIEKLIPDLPAKLAYLGFAYEAAHFQNMTIYFERLIGTFETVSYEKLAFYQMLADDLSSAEETMVYAVRNLKAQSILRNNFYLKLAGIAHLKKDYKQSLSYYLDLNLKYWGKTLRNPFLDESISVIGAKDLIAVAIWKAKGPIPAVQALSNLKLDGKLGEEELFVKLRIAHILTNDRPETAEKMTEEVIYLAQSKGWKKVEYAATVLNGYCNIINKKYRKAIIQFTKSQGILSSSESWFSSEWLRSSGIFTARFIGKERGSHFPYITQAYGLYRKYEQNDDLLSLKNFMDARFDTGNFLKNAVNYHISNKNYTNVLEILYLNQRPKLQSSVFLRRSILQVPFVHKRMALYKGFRPAIDNNYYKSGLAKLREAEASFLSEENETFDQNSLKKISDPLVAAFTFQDAIHIFFYNPETSSRWSHIAIPLNDYKTQSYYEKIGSFLSGIESYNTAQVLLNPIGLDLAQYLKKRNQGLLPRMFYGFTKSSRSYGELQPTAVNCSGGDEYTNAGVQYLNSEYFEGMKSFSVNERLHIWNLKENVNSETGFEKYSWKCENNTVVSFPRVQRRMDGRMLPISIFFTSPSFSRAGDTLSLESFLMADFWMRRGVSMIYYSESSEPFSGNELLETLSKPNSMSYPEIKAIQSAIRTTGKDIIMVVKEIR